MPVGEPELVGGAALGSGGGADRHPVERPRELAAVGVRVHPHRPADGAGDVDAELEPGEPPAARLGGRRRQPDGGPAEQPLAVALDPREVSVELEHQSSESIVRYQQVRSRADHSYLGPDAPGVGEQLDEALLAPGTGEHLGGTAGADRGQSREVEVALDSPGDRHRSSSTRRSASTNTSPAPIVTSRSPSSRRPARTAWARSTSTSQSTRLPGDASAAAAATSRPLTPSSGPTGRSRAG